MGLNLADCVELSARDYPDRCALVTGDSTLTFAELRVQVRRVAAWLQASGFRPGDRAALLLPNIPHFPVLYYGILYAGGIAVPTNPAQTVSELSFLFADCGVGHIFAWGDIAETARAARDASAPEARLTIVPSQDNDLDPVLKAGPEADAMTETQPDDVAVIMYTGAYDGRPRGAQLTHFNLFQNASAVGTRMLHYTPHDRCLAALPLFHSFGQGVTMNAPLLQGACVSLMPRFDAGKVFETIAAEQITVAAFVPTMYHFLLAQKTEVAPDLASVRLALVGGAAMPMETFAAFQTRFGITVLEGYGLTETSPVVSFNMTTQSNRPGSVGLPLWGCAVRIADSDGHALPAGEVGEVLVRGHNVMKGYLNRPEANAATLRNGWLHTGDWGLLDEDGYLHLRGLKKDMLIRAGLNVYPREVERVLERHPAVREAAVVGIPDRVRGEEPKAFVVLDTGGEDLEKSLKQWCRDHLAAYKCPRVFEPIAALPRDPSGQVDKAALRSR